MISLSELSRKENIIEVFMGALAKMWPDAGGNLAYMSPNWQELMGKRPRGNRSRDRFPPNSSTLGTRQ